jgi:peptide/nickel transport system permease protein
MWRALMLDTLGEPYIKVARSKGLSERKVVWKHALRVAANPFLSSIGGILAAILSGEIIVSITMNLPTTGPLFYEALISQDTYLASSFLMFLSILNLLGILLSDILLAIVDPRIRYD